MTTICDLEMDLQRIQCRRTTSITPTIIIYLSNNHPLEFYILEFGDIQFSIINLFECVIYFLWFYQNHIAVGNMYPKVKTFWTGRIIGWNRDKQGKKNMEYQVKTNATLIVFFLSKDRWLFIEYFNTFNKKLISTNVWR